MSSMEDKEKEIEVQAETKADNEVKAEEAVEENNTFSMVSIASNQKKISFVLFILLISGVLYYFLFISSNTSDKKVDDTPIIDKTEKKKLLEDAKPITKAENVKDTEKNGLKDKPLQVPQVEAPEPPPPPPASLSTQSLPKTSSQQESGGIKFHSPFSDDSEEEKQKQREAEARMKAGIMVKSGGGSGGILDGDKKKEKTKKSSSEFLGFGDGSLDGETLGDTTFPKVKATAVNHLNRTILQGKIVYAILETAINTDIPGMLRAIVTRDVYAERGTDIMIPKGSRLIGQYTATAKGGQTRVAVMWERLIRPDGIDIGVASPRVDTLGRTGVAGDIHDHFWRKLGNTFLVSFVVPVASAKAAQKATNKKTDTDKKTTTDTDGTVTVTTTGDPVEQAISDSTKQFSDLTKGMVQDSFSTKPTLTINQGTAINVLVQKDLIFPPQSALQKRNVYK